MHFKSFIPYVGLWEVIVLNLMLYRVDVRMLYAQNIVLECYFCIIYIICLNYIGPDVIVLNDFLKSFSKRSKELFEFVWNLQLHRKPFLTTRKKFRKAKQMGLIMDEDNLTGQ
jgi:hypothetical protein